MKTFRSILSVAFAFLVLFSSTSFMVGIHICSGDVKDVALFTKAEACKNEKKIPPCHRQLSKPCCEDEAIVHDAQGFKGDLAQVIIAATPVVDIAQPSVLLAEVIPSAPLSRTLYYNYDPPLRSCDLTVTLQVFLI